MTEWNITDEEIVETEKLLLPENAHFSDDARSVIRCWHSTDVVACPGSGKTTVLLAKLKILADRMPFEHGAGICVLSHTNVAIEEIKKRLPGCSDMILSYPNYVGTIQAFIDQFITMPYLRIKVGRHIQPVDDTTYAKYMLSIMQSSRKYSALEYVVGRNYDNGKGQFPNRIEHTKELHLDNKGALCIGKQKVPLARADKVSTQQYKQLISELLIKQGIIRYQDAFMYAEQAIADLNSIFTDLFSRRFNYVFIDEYQDCSEIQRKVLEMVFDSKRNCIIHIGDIDQAIYNSSSSLEEDNHDWVPQNGYLSILCSCRYTQEIADAISRLKIDKCRITSVIGTSGINPVLFIFDESSIGRVIGSFIKMLDICGLYSDKGIYKAIGAVKSEDTSGLRVGSYWSGFDGTQRTQGEYNYWSLIGEISDYLSEGKVYMAEKVYRKLLCRILHFRNITNPKTQKEYTIRTIKELFNPEANELYKQQMLEMIYLYDHDLGDIDFYIRSTTNKILSIVKPEIGDAFSRLPGFFTNKDKSAEQSFGSDSKNVLIDPIRGRRIQFDTIHGVKGETHDATLYLETERRGGSDLKRVLPYLGVGKIGSSKLYEYSRKLAYVGMSRPRFLLCVAMHTSTYQRGKEAFENSGWNIINLNKSR